MRFLLFALGRFDGIMLFIAPVGDMGHESSPDLMDVNELSAGGSPTPYHKH